MPLDPRIDDFDCGNEEVERYFKSRIWFSEKKGCSPPTYQFFTEEEGAVVGYAAAGFKNCPHPMDESAHRERVLLIYAIGVNRPFQGQKNPRATNETFAVSMLGVLEDFALKKDGCVGLQLWVRADNASALGFYRKSGFVPDPSGPVQGKSGAPLLTMRKPVLVRKTGT